MLQLAIGGLYPAPDLVEAVLAPRSNEKIAILDLGWYSVCGVQISSQPCLGAGSGAWCIQMAEAFPHADVVGGMIEVMALGGPPIDRRAVDLVPNASRIIPTNCRQALISFKPQFRRSHHFLQVRI